MTDSKKNYEYVEQKLQEYRERKFTLKSNQNRLEKLKDECAELRKLTISKSNLEASNKLKQLNEERVYLKEQISIGKKVVKQLYSDAELLILSNITAENYEVYQNQLSRLYGKKIDILTLEIGDSFDFETCNPIGVIITHNKSQHGKVLKMLDFGLKDRELNVVDKKIDVEICWYNRKIPAGTVMQYDNLMFRKI
ncbi:MAG: hypothetical protein IKV61_01810 [Clostridia bacterium]|nr:hypothetical protein [Clostridia bacterium]